MLFSPETFKELRLTLYKTKFSRFVSVLDCVLFLSRIKQHSVFVTPEEKISICRDPKDNKFLELAVTGNATCIITGDKDLLVLNPFRGIKIVSPSDFLIQF